MTEGQSRRPAPCLRQRPPDQATLHTQRFGGQPVAVQHNTSGGGVLCDGPPPFALDLVQHRGVSREDVGSASQHLNDARIQ